MLRGCSGMAKGGGGRVRRVVVADKPSPVGAVRLDSALPVRFWGGGKGENEGG